LYVPYWWRVMPAPFLSKLKSQVLRWGVLEMLTRIDCSLLIPKVTEVWKECIDRTFTRLEQRNNDSITSFNNCFGKCCNACYICLEPA
jgi:hypothetical protein